MNKIKNVSFFFRVLFQVLLIILPVSLAIYWIEVPLPLNFFQVGVSWLNATFHFLTPSPGNGITFGFIPISINNTLSQMTPFVKLMGFIINLIPLTIGELTLYFLMKLFILYENAEIFSLHSVAYIRKIGYVLLIGQLINPIYDGLLTLAITWNNPHGQRIIACAIDSTNLGLILMASVTIVISWIIAEACKLREEQEYTV